MFSVHMYGSWKVGGSYNTTEWLPKLANAPNNLPVIIGEFCDWV